MRWRPHFERGTELFKQGKFHEALEQFNRALANDGEAVYILYDSRAAVYTALNRPTDALCDAKTTIGLAPQQWHGYARAARLFMEAHNFDASLTMVDRALARVRPEDHTQHEELSELRQTIVESQQRPLENLKKTKNYIAQIPTEIFMEILQRVLADDYAQIIALLHVCAFWRQVIWETPSFWHTLILSEVNAEKKASLWLDRAKKRIRELRVLESYDPKSSVERPSFLDPYDPRNFIGRPSFLDCYDSKSSIGRPSFLDDMDWSYLRICKIQSPGLLLHLFPRTMFSCLDELEINVGGSYNNAFMLCLPELKSLSIMYAPCLTLATRQLPTCLTSLYLKRCSINGEQLVYNLLFSNPQLESLYLDACHISSGGSPISLLSSLNFPNLKTLDLITTFGIAFLFRSTFPALQKLRLDTLPYPNISAFLKADFPCLTAVSLKKIALDEAALCNMLISIRMLESFTLNGIHANKAIDFLGTMGPDGLPCHCPRLRYLDVSGCPDIQTSTLHSLVKQRLYLSTTADPSTLVAVKKLEVLKMNECPTIKSDWLPWFEEHVAEVSCVYNLSRARVQRSFPRRMYGF